MNKNRFTNCKTFEDLYSKFSEIQDICDYNNVSADELETVAKVFEAHVEPREMPDVPLTDKGYEYIWNYTIDTIENVLEEKEDVTMLNDTTKTNETVDGVEKGTGDIMTKFNEKLKEAKINLTTGTKITNEEFVEKTDESFNTLKEAFGNVLNALDNVLGYSTLKGAILDMMEASMPNGSSREDIFKMAAKCRELIDNEVKRLQKWGGEKSLKKALQLKALTEDERGKSVFESFASGIIWVVEKLFDKVKIEDQKERKGIFSSICKGLSAFARVLKAGVTIVWNAVKFVGSFVISGIVIISEIIYKAVKTAVEKVKDWATKKDNFIEDFEDDDEDAGDGVFGTNLA